MVNDGRARRGGRGKGGGGLEASDRIDDGSFKREEELMKWRGGIVGIGKYVVFLYNSLKRLSSDPARRFY